MFIVSKKLGFLGVVIPSGVSVIAELISEDIFGKYHFPSDLLIGICFVISSLIIWILGSKINGNRHGEIMYPIQEPQTIKSEKHTLFWIPLEYCSIPIFLLGMFWLYLYFKI